MTRRNEDDHGSGRDDTSVPAGEGSSDYGDSFLREVLEYSPVLPWPQPGSRLGGRDGRRFEVLGKLGRGGMGMVVRARDEVLQRVVALKFISPGREFTEEMLDRLLQEEARLVAQLDHDNIVRIFDVSEWRGAPFLIMEYLEGQSLEEVLRRGPLELQRSLHILSDVTAGLAHAHSRGIIHRDLKPSNVFILPDGRVKLLDFGLARLASSLGIELARSGTPSFMAPEQWLGRQQDLRTDIWAAGLLLYEMLAGESPHPSENLQDLKRQVTSDEPVPSIRTYRPDLPELVDRFLARALAKEPARRFQSALEMHEQLRALEWSLSPSAEAPPRFIPHRRHVTLVSCRFSGQLASFDPEDLGDLQAAFHQACSREIERHGGWVALRMGGEVLGCFGYPLAREDDVQCAMRTALELTRLAERLPEAAQTGLAVHVGVHTDLVVLDVSAAPQGAAGPSPSIQGEAPRVAKWLAEQAAPNTVNLSENTWQGARGSFITEPMGPRAFSSSLGEVRVGVHRLVRERPEHTRFERARTQGLTPLVGRTRELGQLLAKWEETRTGQGAVVLLCGEAGLGKSRLIQELCAHVLRQGALCVSSQCWPQLNRSAFHPVLDWVVQLLGLQPETPPCTRWARLEEVLGALDLPLPESLQLLGPLLDLPPREGLPPLLLSPEVHRERTLETLTALLLRLPAKLPGKEGRGSLLLVLEDLHWADPSTLRLLTRLKDRIELTGLYLVLSTRPELRLSWAGQPGFVDIALERLAADETAEMVRRLTANGPELTAETLELLVRRTEGNPLFVEELTRRVLTQAPSGAAELTAGPLPISLQELLMARLDALPQEQKELAWKGAVLGRSFTLEQLTALSEQDVSTLRRDLEELVEAGLLLHKGSEPEPCYEFRHALIQEAAYESLLKPRRREYHHRVASLLEHPLSGNPPAPPELIAHHYTQAGELTPAITYWARAGELALHRSAFEESVGHLEQALRLFRRQPAAARHVAEELRLMVLLGQALVAARSYSAPEVDQLYARIPELFQDVRDIPILITACRGLFVKNMMRLNIPVALKLAEQIVSLGERVQSPQLIAVGRSMEGMNHLMQGQVVAARRALHEAVVHGSAEAEQEPVKLGVLDTDMLAMALAYEAMCCTIQCEQRAGLRLIAEAKRRAERIGHPYTCMMTYEAAALLHWVRFDPRRMLEEADKAVVIFERGLFPSWEGWGPGLRGWALLLLGRPEEGYEMLLKDFERIQRAGAEVGGTTFLSLVADARLRLGRISEGLAAVSEGLAWGERTGDHLEDPELHRLHGELLFHSGELARALGAFEEAIRLARDSGALCIELRATLSLCHLLREQGRSREAQRLLLEHLQPLAPGLDSPEIRVARVVLARLQEEHGEADQADVDRLMAAAPWEIGHISTSPTPTFMEPP